MDTGTGTGPESVELFLKLLLAFRALPATKSSRTLMEVAGYPHYENVCSNILGFYFDPTAEHGMKDLLMSAFLRMADIREVPHLGKVSVTRELGTPGGKRIDLVIDCDVLTIGIENKIFHWEANDFEEYARLIGRLGKGKEIVIKAVLGLHPVRESALLKGGFVSYTYAQLWSHVRELLGHYISHADPKWVSYLVDFIETNNNLAGANMELKKTDQFFIEHHAVIEQMFAERNAFLARLNQKVATLTTLLSEAAEAVALSKPPWIYLQNCLVLDFQFAGVHSLAFDVYLQPNGWELQLFARNKKSREFLIGLVGQPPLRERVGRAEILDDRHILQRWPIATDLGEIRDALIAWIRALTAAAKSPQA